MSLSAQTDITVWDEGDDIPLRVEVRDVNGELADPVNGVAGYYLKPRGVKTAVVLTRSGVGVYLGSLSPVPGEYGDWTWSAETDGADATIPKMYEEHTFTVRQRKVG